VKQPAKLLLFRLDDRQCALNLEQVMRVVHAVDVSPLPGSPEVVMGAIDLHGDVVPVFDMRRRFGFSSREIGVEDQFIIARGKNRAVALAVDEVRGIVDGAANRIVPAEQVVGRALDHVDGVVQLEDGLALIHDLDRFLSLDEERELAAALAGSGDER
jgi:purine-binding chemotaxis protein CheW